MDTRVNRFVSKEFLSITNSYTLTELIMHKWCTLWSCESSVKNAVNLVALFCFAIWYLSTHQTFLKPAKFNKTCLKQTLSVQNKMGLALFFNSVEVLWFFSFFIFIKYESVTKSWSSLNTPSFFFLTLLFIHNQLISRPGIFVKYFLSFPKKNCHQRKLK